MKYKFPKLIKQPEIISSSDDKVTFSITIALDRAITISPGDNLQLMYEMAPDKAWEVINGMIDTLEEYERGKDERADS